AVAVAAYANDRMEQPVDDQAARGDRAGHRIDQEGHVVIGDADPHAAPAELRAERFHADEGFSRRPSGRALSDDPGRGACILVAEVLEFAGQGALLKDPAEVVAQGQIGTIAGYGVAGAPAPGSGLGPGALVGR